MEFRLSVLIESRFIVAGNEMLAVEAGEAALCQWRLACVEQNLTVRVGHVRLPFLLIVGVAKVAESIGPGVPLLGIRQQTRGSVRCRRDSPRRRTGNVTPEPPRAQRVNAL